MVTMRRLPMPSEANPDNPPNGCCGRDFGCRADWAVAGWKIGSGPSIVAAVVVAARISDCHGDEATIVPRLGCFPLDVDLG